MTYIDAIRALLAVGWIALTALAIGARLLGSGRLQLPPVLERVLQCALGLGLLAYGVFALGLAGLLYGVVLAGGLLALTWLLRREIRDQLAWAGAQSAAAFGRHRRNGQGTRCGVAPAGSLCDTTDSLSRITRGSGRAGAAAAVAGLVATSQRGFRNYTRACGTFTQPMMSNCMSSGASGKGSGSGSSFRLQAPGIRIVNLRKYLILSTF